MCTYKRDERQEVLCLDSTGNTKEWWTKYMGKKQHLKKPEEVCFLDYNLRPRDCWLIIVIYIGKRKLGQRNHVLSTLNQREGNGNKVHTWKKERTGRREYVFSTPEVTGRKYWWTSCIENKKVMRSAEIRLFDCNGKEKEVLQEYVYRKKKKEAKDQRVYVCFLDSKGNARKTLMIYMHRKERIKFWGHMFSGLHM